MKRLVVLGIGIVTLGLALGACSKEGGSKVFGGAGFQFESDKGDPLAKIGSVTITVEGLADKIKQQPPFLAQRYAADPKSQEQFLENQIRQELLAQEALRRGFINSPEVQAGLKRLLVQKLTQTEFENVKTQMAISPEEVKSYYDTNVDEFHRPEKVKANYIKVPFGDNKNAAMNKAKQVQKKLSANKKEVLPKAFETAMTEQNQAADKNAVLNYSSQEEVKTQFGDKVAQGLWATAESNMTQVLEGQDAYYIFFKSNIRAASDKDFEGSKASIERKLQSKKRSEAFTKLVDDLKKNIGVTVYAEKLSKVSSLTGAPAAPAAAPDAPSDM